MALDYLRYLAGENYREKATEWFENYYGSAAYKAPGHGGLIEDYSQKLADMRSAYETLKRQLGNPAPGWYTLGSFAAHEDVRLQFWGVDESGTPLWERPVPGEEPVSDWAEVPLDSFRRP